MSDCLEFDHFNFKLAVIQELMYEQEILTPKFDVYGFCAAEHPSIDPDGFYYEPIPEVRRYFEALAIPKSCAAEVRSLFFDGGNDIYAQLIPQWDGEDGQFDLESVSERELAQFPNLKTIEGTVFPFSDSVIALFEAKGIDIIED